MGIAIDPSCNDDLLEVAVTTSPKVVLDITTVVQKGCQIHPTQ